MIPFISAALVIAVWALGRKTIDVPWTGRKALLALALVVVLSGAAVEAAIFHAQETEAERTAKLDPASLWEQYRSEPVQNIPVEDDDPLLGSRNHPTQLIVFSSFGCPSCRTFSEVLHRLHARFGDGLTIVFKHFPLSSECNLVLRRDFQPRSCEASWAAEAANRQGAFWPFHAGIFRSDLSGSESALQQIARETKVDIARWETDRVSAAVQSNVKRSVDLGQRLQVNGTPWKFVNGRRFRRLSFADLEVVISRLMEQPNNR
jgi:protein-disulfide isomerase